MSLIIVLRSQDSKVGGPKLCNQAQKPQMSQDTFMKWDLTACSINVEEGCKYFQYRIDSRKSTHLKALSIWGFHSQIKEKVAA